MIRILMLLSQIEGYIAGNYILPDYMAEGLSDICELLSTKIKETP